MPFQPGKPKTGGRKPGQPNHTTQVVRDAVILAAQKAGGGDLVEYLTKQAIENPTAFLTLLGKTMPLQLANERDKPFIVSRVEYVIVDPREPQAEPMLTFDSREETKQ